MPSKRPYQGRKKLFRVSYLVNAVIAIACALLLLLLYLLLTSLKLRSEFTTAENRNIIETTSQLPTVAIFIQQSPVRPKKQIVRLSSINDGYARWTNSVKSQQESHDDIVAIGPVQVFAAVRNSSRDNQELVKSFENMKVINTFGNTAFHKLIDGFVALLSASSCDWIVMGNDHSFFFLFNLKRFLSLQSSISLFYGGNHLALNYHKKLIHFASGGAGAIFSRGSVNALLVVWVYLHQDYFHDMREFWWHEWPSSVNRRDCIADISLLGSENSWRANIQCLLFLAPQVQNVTVKVSPVTEIRIYHQGSRNVWFEVATTVEQTMSKSSYNSLKFSLHDAQTFCSCSSKWSMDNPGLIVAGCLQELFKVSFTDISILRSKVLPDNNIELFQSELFNIYGPVRLLTSDIDDWCVNMKNSLFKSSRVAKNQSVYTKHSFKYISGDVISFHYISEKESTLLYKFFTSKELNWTPKSLSNMWPHGEDVGDYSRPLKSLAEAKSLLDALHRINNTLFGLGP